MKKNLVLSKLKSGQPSVGTWLSLPDPLAARFMAKTGFDWLTVELEHTPTNMETAAVAFAHIAAAGCTPLVRIPWNTGENIKRVLDNGAFGIIVPMVNSRAEAMAAVSHARYNPLGCRSIGGQAHAANFETDPATYYANANKEIMVTIMIEHVEGVKNAEEILSVPGIDVCFIGPNDLHSSMGKKPSFESNDPEFVQALERVLQTCRKYGVAPGIHVSDPDAAKRRIAQGFQFIAVASEIAMMLGKAKEITAALGLGTGQSVLKY